MTQGLKNNHSPGGSVVKDPMQELQETRVQSLGQEEPLEEEMATHSSTLAIEIPWMEEPGRLQTMGSQRVGHDYVITPPPSSRVFQL